MSVSVRSAQMYFFIPGKYRGNMPGSEESVIVTEQRSPLLVCESDCTGLKASAQLETINSVCGMVCYENNKNE